MMEFREFRGYVNDNLLYTFPLHWVDYIKHTPNSIEVGYYDETNNDELTIINLDFINIK